jgi:hypothetical protein
MLEKREEKLQKIKDLTRLPDIQPEFGLFSACITILQTLCHKTNILHEELCHYFKDKSFLLFYSAGESTYSPTTDITYANMSFNTAVFGQRASESATDKICTIIDMVTALFTKCW